jgi:hypothetical protein
MQTSSNKIEKPLSAVNLLIRTAILERNHYLAAKISCSNGASFMTALPPFSLEKSSKARLMSATLCFFPLISSAQLLSSNTLKMTMGA